MCWDSGVSERSRQLNRWRLLGGFFLNDPWSVDAWNRQTAPKHICGAALLPTVSHDHCPCPGTRFSHLLSSVIQ
jgi:hypothetical protein